MRVPWCCKVWPFFHIFQCKRATAVLGLVVVGVEAEMWRGGFRVFGRGEGVQGPVKIKVSGGDSAGDRVSCCAAGGDGFNFVEVLRLTWCARCADM